MAASDSTDVFDMALFGAVEDQPLILKLEAILEKFVPHVHGKAIDVVTVGDFQTMSEADKHEHMVESSLLYGLYITPAFCGDRGAIKFKGEALAKTIEDKSRATIPIYSVLQSDQDMSVAGLVGLKGISVPFMLNLKDLKDIDVETLTEKDVAMKLLGQIGTLIQKKAEYRKQQTN